ncbi:MAG: flagellar brake protein [Bacillota bacterium]
MIEQLKEGARLQILQESEQEYYMTNIKSIESDIFTVHTPTSDREKLDMPQYSSWQFCLLGDDAIYFFTSRVVGVSREGADTCYIIKMPDTVHRQQRRGHVRVPCHHDLVYWLWDDADQPGLTSPEKAVHSLELWEDPQWLEDYLKSLHEIVPGKNAFTLDISGGGLRMVTLEPLNRHDRLILKLEIDEKQSKRILLLETRVVRVVPLNLGGWKRYRVGVSFIDLDQKLQEDIISYLFKIMRKKV